MVTTQRAFGSHREVLTMESEQVLEDATVVVTDNRFAAVGPRGTVDIPSDASDRRALSAAPRL